MPYRCIKRLFILFLAIPHIAIASPQDELAATQRAIKEEHSQKEQMQQNLFQMEKELSALQNQIITLTKDIRIYEKDTVAREAHIQQLSAQQLAQEAALAENNTYFMEIIRAMRRLQKLPAVTLVSFPAQSKNWIRTSTMLGYISKELERQAQTIRQSISALHNTRTKLAAMGKDIEERKATLAQKYAFLNNKLEARQKAYNSTKKTTNTVSEKISQLSNKSASLEALITALEQENTLAEVIGEPKRKPAVTNALKAKSKLNERFSHKKGQLPLPAIGKVAAYFGEEYKGEKSKGWYIASRKAAQVVTPHGGKVAFAGPFRNYGNMVIIRHDGGYYTLLAGLGRIHTAPGQILLAKEPVGTMSMSDDDSHILYVELRKHSKAIDPSSWINHVNINSDIARASGY